MQINKFLISNKVGVFRSSPLLLNVLYTRNVEVHQHSPFPSAAMYQKFTALKTIADVSFASDGLLAVEVPHNLSCTFHCQTVAQKVTELRTIRSISQNQNHASRTIEYLPVQCK